MDLAAAGLAGRCPAAPGPVGHAVADLAAFLVGGWRLQRVLTSAAGEALGSVTGTVTFRTTPASTARVVHLEVEEVGTLHRPDGVALEVGRRLGYRVAGSRAEVSFADGRAFHDLDLTAGVWEVVHPCLDDRYVGRFDVTGPDRWVQRWQVRGPRKDYVSESVLERAVGT